MVQDFAKIRASAAQEKTPVPAPANRGLLFTGLLTGFALGVFGSFLVYLSGALPPLGEQQAQNTDNAASMEADLALAQQKLNEDLERAAARLQLEFYQELPNYEVIVSTVPGSSPPPVRRSPQTSPAPSEAQPDPRSISRTEAETVALDPQADAIARTIAELTGAAVPVPVPMQASAQPVANAIQTENRAGGLSYMIQAGAFQQEQAAQQQSNRLVGLGLDARVKKEALLGKTLFLVQAGPYHSRDQLSQVERILRSNNIDSMRITLGGP
jgi:cell division protein FtsN